VNPLDIKIRAGAAAHARHPLPAILGLDLAGTIEATGEDVARFRRGDEVYGMTGGVGGQQGSLAEFAAGDADLVALKPVNVTMREAAALPLTFITAWEGLIDAPACKQAGPSWCTEDPVASATWQSRSPGPLEPRSLRRARQRAGPSLNALAQTSS